MRGRRKRRGVKKGGEDKRGGYINLSADTSTSVDHRTSESTKDRVR